MDLISREAAIETVKKLLYETAFNSCGHHQDDEIYADIAEHRIEVWLGLVPSATAVPLDKLCEWLAERYEPPYTLIDIDKLKAPIDFRQQKEIWLVALTKWMEEQDVQKEN